MKGESEFNAMLLLYEHYKRLKKTHVSAISDDELTVSEIPKSLMHIFHARIQKMIEEELKMSYDMLEDAAKKYAEAAK